MINKTIWKDLDEKDIDKGFDNDWKLEFETIFASKTVGGTKTAKDQTVQARKYQIYILYICDYYIKLCYYKIAIKLNLIL